MSRHLFVFQMSDRMILIAKQNKTNKSPYRTIPSKNGILPKGVFIGYSGSGILGMFLAIAAMQTKRLINSPNKLSKASSGFIHCKMLLSIFIILFSLSSSLQAKCPGRFVNPITDICWKCVFPLTIMGVDVGGNSNPQTPRTPICICNRPPLNQPTPGIPVGF